MYGIYIYIPKDKNKKYNIFNPYNIICILVFKAHQLVL